MRLFKQTPEDYYNAPYAEFPALIRGTVVVVMGILWVFSKLMWRWKVEDADLLFERKEGRGSVVICNHTSMAELLAVETALLPLYWQAGRQELFCLYTVMEAGYFHSSKAQMFQ